VSPGHGDPWEGQVGEAKTAPPPPVLPLLRGRDEPRLKIIDVFIASCGRSLRRCRAGSTTSRPCGGGVTRSVSPKASNWPA